MGRRLFSSVRTGRAAVARSHRRAAAARPPRAAAAAVLLAVAGALVPPALVAAHPLGNFTINHYAEVRIEPRRVLLDVVIDQAEIPAFQERQAFDLDLDGIVSDEEIEGQRVASCRDLAGSLRLTADEAELALETSEAGLSFPPGVGGLSTLRLVCGFEAALLAPIGAAPTRIAFSDDSHLERLGWREIVARGSGVTLTAVDGELRDESPSVRLTEYPDAMVAIPLRDGPLVVDAVAGGEALPPLDIPDAEPPTGVVPPSGPSSAEPTASPGASPVASPPSPAASPTASPAVGAVPGGIGGGELPAIFRADLTPLVVLLSLLAAAGLGAGHALTPGHGKTLMAAYLVGARGTARHALALGLSVSLSHTVGILVLAGLVLGASDLLPPDVVVRWAPLVAAVSIAAIGAWMLLNEVRRRRAAVVHEHEHEHEQRLEHAHAHDHEPDHPHAYEYEPEHEHDHPHQPEREHPHDHDPREPMPATPGEHSHGGIRHSHLSAAGTAITWRSLFVLGLAGGLIPSTSALLILLGSIAAGRPAFGFVLVAAFGLGMAAVMAGVGLVMVVARSRLDRLPDGGGLGRLREAVPMAAAVLVFGFGIYLTAQALAATPTL